MTRLAIGAAILGVAALGALLAWSGAAQVQDAVLAAAWVLPALLGVHAAQLLLSTVSWRLAMAGVPGHARLFVLRLIREAVNSLLPLAHIGGNAVAIRRLARDGVPLPTALAGTTLDVFAEAASQAVFTLLGIALLTALREGQAAAYVWGGGVSLLTAAALAGLIWRGPPLAEAAADRLARRFPGLRTASLTGLHAETQRLVRRTGPLSASFALQMLAWVIGTAETAFVLTALGVPQTLPAALVIESLGQAARSAGFAVPGAVGVQEGGFVAACGLFGLPPETGLALSVIKRAREMLVGFAGMLAWWLV